MFLRTHAEIKMEFYAIQNKMNYCCAMDCNFSARMHPDVNSVLSPMDTVVLLRHGSSANIHA